MQMKASLVVAFQLFAVAWCQNGTTPAPTFSPPTMPPTFPEPRQHIFTVDGTEYRVFCPSGNDRPPPGSRPSEIRAMPVFDMVAIIDTRADAYYPRDGPKGHCICPATHYGTSSMWFLDDRNMSVASLQFQRFCTPCSERKLVQGRFGENPFPFPFPIRNATEDDCRHFRGCKHDPCDTKVMPLVWMFVMIALYLIAIGGFTWVYKTFIKDWYRAYITAERKEAAEKQQRLQEVKDLSAQAKEDDYGRRQAAVADKRACC